MKRLHIVKPTAIEWPFHGEPVIRKPRSFRRGYGAVERVDPFPAYSHDPDATLTAIGRVEASFPLPEPFAPLWVLLPFDTPAYTNGWTEVEWDYDWEGDDRSQRPWRGMVILAGKRIPPHPAVTRYLVAHEYGHVVHHWLQRLAHEQEHEEGLYREYAKVRGLRPAKTCGGGTWHRSTSELFANDFRILVAGVETDYWPHPGIPRPEEVPGIEAWWAERVPTEQAA